MTAKELIEDYKKHYSNPDRKVMRNSMGCSEDWYDPVFCICNTFNEDDILSMDDKTINNMVKLAGKIGECLY